MSSAWKRTTSKAGSDEDFPRPPAGNHVAVCVGIIAMGTQHQEFGGDEKVSNRAFFVWELLNEKQPGTKGSNFLIGLDLNTSLNEKAKLRKFIEARTGKAIPNDADYDISTELGQPCLLNVVEKQTAKGRAYSRVEGLAAVPKGMPVGKPQTAPYLWSLDDYDGSGKITLPEWVPWCIGRRLPEVIAECDELVGKIDPAKNGQGGSTSQHKPATTPTTSLPPATSGPGRPPGTTTPPPATDPMGELYKVWTPESTWALMDAPGLRNWLRANNFSAANTWIHLSTQLTETNRPATEFGFTDAAAFAGVPAGPGKVEEPIPY